MAKRMSFSMTKQQFLDGSKTVTRRLGWKALRAGDEVIAVEKCMGLKKGERQVVLGRFVVTDVRQECLADMTQEDCAREGFPHMAWREFVEMFRRAMRCELHSIVTRIEFRKLSDPRGDEQLTAPRS